MPQRFRDRVEAGRALALQLVQYRGRSDVIVLALPRGGVPVGYEVARELGLPLDVFVVRKLGMPGHEEFAIGAIASGGVRVLDEDSLAAGGVSTAELERITTRERTELERRERLYRHGRPPLDVSGRTAILVDDGLATGQTMRAGVAALRREGASAVVVAVPVAASETCEAFRELADDVVCIMTPDPFMAVGLWYEDFSQTSDAEVERLLASAAREKGAAVERDVAITTTEPALHATLAVPGEARGVVIFAHGSGSSRFSPRNRYVARVLHDAGLATLLLDLLSREEERIDEVTREHRFDIPLLAARVAGAVGWATHDRELGHLPVGVFGASTGAAAALVAAAELPGVVGAVVSRGGRPDLAGDALPRVRAPTLLIVGQYDEPVIRMNRDAMAMMHAPVKMEIVPRATHLFEEEGTLEVAARLARDWFVRHLAAGAPVPAGHSAG